MRFKNFATLTFIVTFFLFSCKDDPSSVGLGILPGGDKLSVTYLDTISVTSSLFNYNPDLELASNEDVIYLGKLNDPVFGQIQSQLLSEMRATSFVYDDKEKIADSMVLRVKYSKLYGNPNATFKFSVYKLTDTLRLLNYNLSQIYAYPNTLNLNKYVDFINPIGHGTINKSDSSVSIRLNNEFMQEIASMDSATLNTDTMFRKQKIAIYIQPEINDPTGAIASFNLNLTDGTGSGLTYSNDLVLYYHTANNTGLRLEFDLISYQPSSNSYIYVSPKANICQHNYKTAIFNSEITGGAKDTVLYTLGSGGIKTRLNFANLKNLLNNNVHYAVSQALLVIPYYPNKYFPNKASGSYINQETALNIEFVRNDSLFSYSQLFLPYSISSEGGKLDTTTGYFTLSITQYVQDFLNNKIYTIYGQPVNVQDLDIVVVPSSSNSSMNGAILKRDKNIKLKIKYTKF